MNKQKNIKLILWFTLAHIIVISGLFLLFHPHIFTSIKRTALTPAAITSTTKKEFAITFNTSSTKNDPVDYDFFGEREISFIYEPLVIFDDFFNIRPALASSWGMLSETEWKFFLRQDVLFHDGSTFNADDFLASFQRAQNHPNSIIRDFILTIKSIEKIDNYTIIIKTKKPSPIFLSKLTNLYIIPEELANQEIIEKHIGTGPFEFVSKNTETIHYKKFENYWDKSTLFPRKMVINIKFNKYERLGDIITQSTDILGDVPPLFAEQIKKRSGGKLIQSPGVKTMFLLFNLKSSFLQKHNNRMALSHMINRDKMLEIVGTTSRLTYQFAGSGIFGYNPEIIEKSFNIDRAQNIIQHDKYTILTINVTDDNVTLAEFLKKQFEGLNVRLKLNVITAAELEDNLRNGVGDLFLLGWNFSEGSVDEFFEQVVLSDGMLNGIQYNNEEVDEKIKTAIYEINEKIRLESLQEIMKIISDNDLIGIPLFTIDNLTAIMPTPYTISTRPDGIIHF